LVCVWESVLPHEKKLHRLARESGRHMFNLDQAISEWRKQMLAAGIQTPVPLEELECHLREEIEQQMKSGTNVPLAFETAVRVIGKANMLKLEFKKVEETKEARASKRSQIALIFSLCMFLLPFTAYFVFDPELTSGERMFGLAAVATTVLFLYIGHLGGRLFPVILNRQVRLITGLSGCLLYVVWVTVFVHVVLPRLDFTESQLFVAICWAWTVPVGVLGGLILGLEKAALKKAAMSGS
jgi:hypothetical protein